MARHAAFLRGVNLGRHRRVTSDQLRSCFEAIGFDDVATFRSSGNVAFDAGRASRANLTARIEQGLADALGFDVVVFLRTAAEVRATADQETTDRWISTSLIRSSSVAVCSAIGPPEPIPTR